ncbi:MAG TPA: succinyl-diaminopimelate desuccinylase [Gammaproteobacteria bacterium]|nr:succinyl-diaminopimelate desuccinylase [Gammaproteobacteria bacterium]
MSSVLQLCSELVARPSVTPDDSGCQQLLAARLQPLGFTIEHLRFGEVDNLWAVIGDSGPLFCFAGHTDVVPPGELEQWHSDPFEPTIRDGMLFGRGAADMKGSLAAMVVATELFLASNQLQGRLAFLITSDEEGPAVDGTTRVLDWLAERDIQIDCCLVGEPSSAERLADRIRNGRRGSLNGTLKLFGVQGHVAYPDDADNPIHRVGQIISDLAATEWDQGDERFPPTSFQISNINGGTGATNVIPGQVRLDFNFRHGPASPQESLKSRLTRIVETAGCDYELSWTTSGAPFFCPAGSFIDSVCDAIAENCGTKPELSTGGGTSDGRFIATTGTQVVELGPRNASIHKINESTPIDELEQLTQIYLSILHRVIGSN